VTLSDLMNNEYSLNSCENITFLTSDFKPDRTGSATTDGRLGDILATLPKDARLIWLHPWGFEHLNRTPITKLSSAKPLHISDELIKLELSRQSKNHNSINMTEYITIVKRYKI
jgi:hypothetical protein